MNDTQRLLTVLIMMAATMLTRFLPLLLFKKELPKKVQKIVNNLPYALMGLLVVYTLKDSFSSNNVYGILEITGLLVISVVYRLSDHVLLSIGCGLSVYLLLVNAL
jgi:branched-subunit amino acid transport protein AzlD